jgi:hypothetical protein
MTPWDLVLVLGAGWLLIAAVLAVFIGKAIKEMNDDDCPEHVNRQGWERVTRANNAPIRRN